VTELNSLTGVVEPVLPGMPELPEEEQTINPFAGVVDHTKVTLAFVDETIERMVNQREEINKQVKNLREWKDRLERMLRIAEKEV
jgi:hypothetical protein